MITHGDSRHFPGFPTARGHGDRQPWTRWYDLIQSGANREAVPVRDPQAIADVVLKWADKIRAPGWRPRVLADAELLPVEHFEHELINQLCALGLARQSGKDCHPNCTLKCPK
jgi:hypothetical protein